MVVLGQISGTQVSLGVGGGAAFYHSMGDLAFQFDEMKFFFLLTSVSFSTIFKKPKGQEDLLIYFFSKGFIFLSLNLGLYFQLI